MRVNTRLQVHPDLDLALWSMFGKWRLDREGRGRRAEWEGGEGSPWGYSGNGVQPCSLPMWVLRNSTHPQVVHKLLLDEELQLILGQGVSVPLPSRVLVEDINDDIHGLLQLRELLLGLGGLEEKRRH